MIVKELKEILNNADDNDLVVLSRDGEGNSYSPLYDTQLCTYADEESWEGQIGLRELTPELIKEGYTEEDLLEDGVNAIVLYPTN